MTGGMDSNVQLFDFGGMDAALQSFRQLTPADGHQVRHLEYASSLHTGACTASSGRALFLCVTGAAIAQVYDRDGFSQFSTVRGDMYITDVRRTTGHITACTSGAWHPRQPGCFMTCSNDGSWRLWDVNKPKRNVKVVRLAKAATKRVPVTAGAFSPDGRLVAGAGADGSLLVWDPSTPCLRPSHRVAKAHRRDTETSGLVFSADNRTLFSRGGPHDGSLKMWDVRKFTAPVHSVSEGLSSHYATTNVVLSPTEQIVVTATSYPGGEQEGELVFFERRTLREIRRINVGGVLSIDDDKELGVGAIQCAWSAATNQIFVTCGDGTCAILYDPDMPPAGGEPSKKYGIMLAVGRRPKRKANEDIVAKYRLHGAIIAPHAQERKPKRSKTTTMPAAPPEPGRGSGGRLGNSAIAHMLKNTQPSSKLAALVGDDPRASLLKYATDKPVYTRGYQLTQPEPIFQEAGGEDDGDGKDDVA